jgi:superfamily II DNA helicase RecQ
MLSWGPKFQKAFKQIGFVRASFPPELAFMALTATLRQGKAEEEVRRVLGLEHCHSIRQSNRRPDIQLIFREIKSGIQGRKFPELDWVLDSKRTTIIFCKTIKFGSRVYEYLLGKDKGDPRSATRRMRMYNSLNCSSYHAETTELVKNSECTLVVGRSSLTVGLG